MHLSFDVVDNVNYKANVTSNGESYTIYYPCNDEVNCTPCYTILPRGNYALEVWGAQGGLSGGKGGYSIGLITLTSSTPVYIKIGAQGSQIINQRGFTTEAYNGGGKGYSRAIPGVRSSGSGGGATDIRFNDDTLYHRSIVAGGGGGICFVDDSYTQAGVGGGENGEDSISGKGGTQNSAPHASGEGIGQGSFGQGGSTPTDTGTAGGGGGGWYGGSSGQQASGNGGAGGSGYALHQKSHKPEGYMLNNQKYFFTYWHLYDGKENVPRCDGPLSNAMEYETGHAGFGCARITFLSTVSFSYHQNMFFKYIPQTLLFVSIILK